MCLSTGKTLRYDGVPLEDFLVCLTHLQKAPQSQSLPQAEFLREARLEAGWRYDVDGPEVPLSLFLLQERDALTERTEVFIIAHAPGGTSAPLREMAVKLKEFLEHRQLPCHFRIDPRYGLVCGSALEPIDETVKWDRPGVYTTLVLTHDLSSPSLALLDYVAQTHRRRYQEIFAKYNRVQPVSVGFLKSTWQRFRGPEKGDHSPRKLSYGMLAVLATFLSIGLYRQAKVSLIFKDVPDAQAKATLLDPGFSSAYDSGHDRFFASLGELA
jgi:hypothetical protein